MELYFIWMPRGARDLYYPESKAAKAIVKLTNNQCLSRKSIEILSDAGFTIIITQPL